MSELESVIEEKLIKQLTTGDSQWNYRPDLKTEEDLWDNIREKLNAFNARKLDGTLITDLEMARIKDFIKDQGQSAYKAGLWLSGEHGLAQIPLQREDAKLGSISLDAIDNREIAGGHSCYEVINQYVSFKQDPSDRDRRFDVTLLINGFPMIHIELKNQNHSYIEAFDQIKKYVGEGKFTGLFGLVQMFVVSNGSDTKYIASAPHDKLNKKFLSSWVDPNNKRVDDYISFARDVLNIPQAHLIVGKYSVLDSNSKSLILLRAYQIHAIEAVKQASREKKSGLIWHTTGSGKTITSFNVTRNLLDIPSIDKAIFLIDRKDLDQQTSLSFQAYAESSGDSITDTQNTKALENALKNNDRQVIVTTRQKLECLLDKCNNAIKNGEGTTGYATAIKIKSKKIAFVVDECHRAVSPSMQNHICEFFDSTTKKSLWYGFTGTPIFDKNKKAENGKNARTSLQQYGSESTPLHQYTIKEAMHDKAVLGFHIQSSGFSKQELEEVAIKLGLSDEYITTLERDKLEEKVLAEYRKKTNGKNFYDSPEHREQVIDYICNKSINLFQLRRPRGETMEAILTCSSIAEAQKYYSEFKEFIKQGKISERVKSLHPDFPKIAITYSVAENEESKKISEKLKENPTSEDIQNQKSAIINQELMKQSINDYNQMFNTNWSLETIGAYNTDLNNRLARKQGRFHIREEQLDLVIVVDRLLTGFDAPCLSTLFIDRQPMSPQGIIQAFSRTNRIFTDFKYWGEIVTFQTPAIFKKAFDKALQLYSDGDSSTVVAPTYEQCKNKLIKALCNLKAFKPTPEDVEVDESTSEEELKKFAKLFQKFDRALYAVKTYEEWNIEAENYVNEEDNANKEQALAQENEEVSMVLKSLIGVSISKKDLDTYQGKYNNAIKIIKERKNTNTVDFDISYELQSVSQSSVDYSYLVSLIQNYMVGVDERAIKSINNPAIDKYIVDMQKKNPKLGDVINEIWEDLKKQPQLFKGMQAIVLINQRIDNIINSKIDSFCNEWCVTNIDMHYHSRFYSKVNGLEIGDMDKFCSFSDYKAKGGELSKISYRATVRKEAEKLIIEEILPLRDR